jgi:Skp family chaperone for outer membrane proteins
MRRIFAVLALAAALPAVAQEPITRFAVFAPERVVETSVRAKKVFAELEVLDKSLREKDSAKLEELQKLDQQIKSPAMSEEGRAKLQRELQEGEVALKRFREDGQAELQKVQQKATMQFNQEISPILMDLAKEMKLQLLMQWNQALIMVDRDSVLSFSDELAKRYDKKYEAGAATEAPKPAAPKPGAAKPAAPKAGPAKK